MSRLQPFQYSRPKMPILSREFTEPAHPEAGPLSITLQRLEPHEQFEAAELGEEKYRLYVTGDPEEGIPPASFPLIDGKPIKLNRLQCLTAAQLVVMQRPVNGEEPYHFEDMIALSYTFPAVWSGLMKMVTELTGAGPVGDAPKNGSGASTSAGCDSPSVPKPETILTSSSEQTPSSAPLTTGSEASAGP